MRKECKKREKQKRDMYELVNCGNLWVSTLGSVVKNSSSTACLYSQW